LQPLFICCVKTAKFNKKKSFSQIKAKTASSCTYICDSVIHNVWWFWGLEMSQLWQPDVRHYKAEGTES